MKCNRSFYDRDLVLKTVAFAAALLVAPFTWAECTQDGAVKFSALIDANTGCGNVAGQFGCRIDDGEGTCTATDGSGNPIFVATSSIAGNGSVVWSVAPPPSSSEFVVGVDFVATGGAAQGNACGYFYQFDSFSGDNMGFQKTNGQYSNVTYVDICGDLALETPPPPPEPVAVIPNCSDVATIDDTGVICPIDVAGESSSIVCNIELTDADGAPVPFFGMDDGRSCCVCNSAQPAGELVECDPGLPELSGGCPEDVGFDTEVTTHFEFNNDPYYCTTVGGKRKCYRY